MRLSSITAAGAALLAGLAFGAPAAQAATATTTFAVTLTVLNQCVVTATPLAFGSLALVGGTGGQATNTLTVTCTAGTPFTIGLNQGTAPTDLKAGEPLVARLPADPVRGAQLGHAPRLALCVGNELTANIHRQHQRPRHSGQKCYPCPRNKPSPM